MRRIVVFWAHTALIMPADAVRLEHGGASFGLSEEDNEMALAQVQTATQADSQFLKGLMAAAGPALGAVASGALE